MPRDKSRNLEWGSANRPKVSNKLGIPNPREGNDGDMQVRQTGIGARLFAKIGGRWLSNLLHGNEIDSPDVFIPKMWHFRGTTPAIFTDNTCDTAIGDATVTMDDTSSLVQYQAVTGTGIPNNAHVDSITDATHFELNGTATANGTNVTLSFKSAQNILLPGFLTWDNVCSIGFMINLGSDNMHAWSWDTPGGAVTDNGVVISDNNRIEVSLDKNLKAVKLLHVASDAAQKDYRLTVFFK